jgi:hypothetical protein
MPSYGRNPAKGLSPRTCEVCGESYQPYRDSQTTCGLTCYKRSAAVRQREAARKARPEARERKNNARRVGTNPARRLVNLRGNIKRYGITLEQYEALLAAQADRCVICGDRPDPAGKGAMARLHVDHHHGTGRNRALLCARCNVGIGYFLEDPTRLRAAAEYIEKHRREETT